MLPGSPQQSPGRPERGLSPRPEFHLRRKKGEIEGRGEGETEGALKCRMEGSIDYIEIN